MFRKITAITFKISTFCNLDCEYCFQKHEVKEKCDKFTMYKELVALLVKLPLDNSLEFKVTGGESSLFCDDIEMAYKQLQKIERYKDTKINFTTITNGTNLEGLMHLMDKGILDPWGCKYSWDGLHSASLSRKPKNKTYNDKFFNDKIKLLGASKYKDKVLVRIALTPNTVDYLYDSFKFALDCGCRKLEYYYLTDCDDYKDKEFIAKVKDQLLKIAKLKKDYDFEYSNWDTLYFTCNLEEKDKLRSITCRHLGRMLYIDMNGDISPCGFFSEDAVFDGCKLIIGNLQDGFYKLRVRQFIDEYRQAPMCNITSCDNLHCFECPATNKHRTGSMQDKLCQTCSLRTLEKEIFLKYNKEILDIDRVKKVFCYADLWNMDYSYPKLPYYREED